MRADKALFASATVSALNTANAYRPPLGGTYTAASMVTWFPALFATELPLHLVALETLRSVPFVAKGGLRSRTGKAAAAIQLASWAGLVNLHRQASRTGEVVEAALVEGLGENYRSEITDEAVAATAPALGLRRIVRSVGRIPTYVTAADTAYHTSERAQMDVWRREDLPLDGKAPVLLQVHGGGWTYGHKGQQAMPLLSHLAESGWICADINYSLGPTAKWPDPIVDVKAAIAWLRQNVAAHGGDPDFIVITGGSAGGHLAALAALTANDPAFQPGFEDVDTTLQGCVPFYGPMDVTEDSDPSGRLRRVWDRYLGVTPSQTDILEAGSPIKRVHADAPPTFVLHGSRDSIIRPFFSREFAQRLRAVSSNPVLFAELPSGNHAFDGFPSVRTHHVVHAVHRFLAHTWAQHQAKPVVSVDVRESAQDLVLN